MLQQPLTLAFKQLGRWLPRPLMLGEAWIFLLLVPALPSLAHGGHGDAFHQNQPVSSASASVVVDPETMARIGLVVEAVTRQVLGFGVQATGQIEARPGGQVEITSPVGGTIVRLLVNPGTRVAQGQALAVMTSGELAELRVEALDNVAERQGAVTQAQAQLRLAQETYERQQSIAQAAIEQARTAVQVAQERYDRDQELLAQGAIARREFLESEAHLATSRQALTAAESRLEVLASGTALAQAKTALQVAQSQAALSATHYQTRLQQLGGVANADGTLTLKAPIAGILSDRQVTVGESTEEAGTPLMTIVDDLRVWVRANVHEKDLSQVAVGQTVRVQVASLPDQFFEGRVVTVGATVEGESRVIPIQAELDNAAGLLKPGLFATLEILTDLAPDPVLAIPDQAIVEAEGQTLVFVQNGSAFQAVAIELGRRAGPWVEVKQGLFEGDRVVTQRASQLYAQSLRGDRSPEEETPPQPPLAAVAPKLEAIPWSLVLPGTGLLGLGTFAAGALWASQRHSQDPRLSPVPSTQDTRFPQPETTAPAPQAHQEPHPPTPVDAELV